MTVAELIEKLQDYPEGAEIAAMDVNSGMTFTLDEQLKHDTPSDDDPYNNTVWLGIEES